MSLIEKIRSDLAAAKGDPKNGVAARPADVTLLNLLLSEITATVSSTKFTSGAKALRKQAEKEGWPLGQLEQAKKDNAGFFKPLRAEALAKVQAEFAPRGEQAVLDAIGVVNDEFDTLLAGADAAAEQTAAEEGWPLGRLEQALIDLGAESRKDPSDDEVIEIARVFLKGAKATHAAMIQRGDEAGARKAAGEIFVLEAYVPAEPEPLTVPELRGIIGVFKLDKPDAKLGDVMAHLKANYAGRYDGKQAATVAQEEIARGVG
ncbi:hypothetical protein HOU03_gp077 [Caulobacter phage CcrSC]|uniref:Uncharacterized protein n=1 Tax=Caulobacter phage CcrSC TaxID=2283272 RepID=A0A385EG03_9CAUD|nr:hypothetical protein HOU03_gp077 [Caulobacter phage CcrSC]AXQ69659.1 hypothetical protein CcrSC_gp077c [Caulobacter phage CcrSC]